MIAEYGVRRGLALKWADSLHLLAARDLAYRYDDLSLVTMDSAFANIAELAGVRVVHPRVTTCHPRSPAARPSSRRKLGNPPMRATSWSLAVREGSAGKWDWALT